MIYLASPYSHHDPEVRKQRFEQVVEIAARLMRSGIHVFCPIAHSHPMTKYGIPGSWDFWAKYDREYLAMCNMLVVVMMDGWSESTGVQAEIGIMTELGKPVRYYDVNSGEIIELPHGLKEVGRVQE